MTKEEAIHEIEKIFEPAFANYIITALTEGATSSDKEQQSKTGHWITNSDYPDKLICSECDSKFDVWWMDKGSNYCPNCGAKMKEENNETNN